MFEKGNYNSLVSTSVALNEGIKGLTEQCLVQNLMLPSRTASLLFSSSADYKAILSKGKVRCAGTSLFLKNRFGIGYHLK